MAADRSAYQRAVDAWGGDPQQWPSWTCACGQRNVRWAVDCGRCATERSVPSSRTDLGSTRDAPSVEDHTRADTRAGWPGWVLDATVSDDEPPFPFCPIVGDPLGEFEVLVGLTVVTDRPPGPLVGVVHADGYQAARDWCDTHTRQLEELAARTVERRLG